jgi:molybdenum cofactor guanylyltransferase
MTSLAAAVILAGGQGRRLGGRDKPAMMLDGRRLLDRALDAVGRDGGGGCPTVVVGPPRDLPGWVISCREDPSGGGPAAAVAAGVAVLPELPANAIVAVLAADLPGITGDTIDRLCAALTAATPSAPMANAPAGALLVDSADRRQYLTGVWRLAGLADAIGRRERWNGAPLRELLAPVPVIEIPGVGRETADIDTPDDWHSWRFPAGDEYWRGR